MRKRAKLLSALLALVMCLTLLPTTALAADTNGFEIENGVLTYYTGSGGAVTIPGNVTSIGDDAFYGCYGLTSVTIPSSVTTIGNGAFANCTGLTSVTIPDSVTSIGDCAFSYCESLTSMTIPGSVTSVEFRAFEGCTSLTSVTILPGVTGIGNFAFVDCAGLISVTIPSSVTTIGNGAFDNCIGLTGVTIPDSVTRIGEFAFANCTGLTGVTIPSSVTSIRVGAFENCEDLSDVYYGGTQEQWAAVSIEMFNDYLTSADIHYNSSGPKQPVEKEAIPTNDKLTVNGVLAEPTVYKINGGNYFKLRDLAVLLNGTSCQFDVGYDGTTNSVTATGGRGYVKLDSDMAGPASGNQTATLSNDKIIVNGRAAQVEVYKIGGGNFFKLRDLGDALGFTVGWDDVNKVASITTNG